MITYTHTPLSNTAGALVRDFHVVVSYCTCVNFPSSFPKLQLELKSQETQGLVEQRDQVVAHLQQYCAGYQALASEREQLHQQYLQQTQLMDRLQHDESHGRAQLEISHTQLQQAQVCISGIQPFVIYQRLFCSTGCCKCIVIIIHLQADRI